MMSAVINIDKLVEDAVANQDKRTRRIILGRYGLGETRRKTLSELGNEYGLTRERVRQIQASYLNSVRGQIKSHKEAIKLLKLVRRYLKDLGHIRRADLVAHDLSIMFSGVRDNGDTFNKLQFIADVLQWPNVAKGNEDWHATWYSEPEVYDAAKRLVDEFLSTEDHDFDKFLKLTGARLGMQEPQVINHLMISKRFRVGPYGDIGADHWIHVNPKTVRDKIYLVLEKSDEPLHFGEIANRVNNLSDKKRAAATVHNELIKDARFNLVGRGTYTIDA